MHLYRYPSLHENLHSVSTTMSTPLDDSEDEAEAAGMEGEQLMSPFRGGCNDGQRRKTHLKRMERCFLLLSYGVLLTMIFFLYVTNTQPALTAEIGKRRKKFYAILFFKCCKNT